MNEKVVEPEVIQEIPFPNQDTVPNSTTSSSPSSQGIVSSPTSKEKSLPKKRSAVELLSTSLNTRSRKVLQSFELEQSGGFQVGNFQEGVSGDVRMTPNGLTGRDMAGITTFALDTDGNLVLKGELQSGSVITGNIIVGNNRVIISVDENGEPSIIVNDGSYDRVLIGFGEF